MPSAPRPSGISAFGDSPARPPSPTLPAGSLLRYSPTLLFVIIAIADAGRFADPDLWGHIRFGGMILASGFTRHDPFSYSAANHLWNDHEWLTEVVLALSYRIGGVIGLKLMKLTCSAALIVLLAVNAAESGAPIFVQSPVLIATAVALGPQLQFRPQLFTFVFLAALLALLTRDNSGRGSPLWLFIPMMVLWVNFHGGFFIGLAVFALYAVTAAARDLWRRRGLHHALGLGGLLAAAMLATFVTPYGLDNWRAVSHTLDNQLTRNLIVEWEPMLRVMFHNAHSDHSALPLYLLILGMMAAFIILLALTFSLDDLPLAAIGLMMTAAAFVSVRNMALAIIAISGPLAHHGAIFAGRVRLRRDEPETAAAIRGRRWLVHQGVLASLALAVLVRTGLFSPTLPPGIPFPAGAIAFMKTHRLNGNILCDFDWGEYVIYRMAPGSKVFIDSRYDLVYPQSVIRDYVKFYFAAPGAAAALDSYPHDYILIPPQCAAYALVAKRPGWKLIYRDPDSALFARANSAAANAADVPVIGKAEPAYFP